MTTTKQLRARLTRLERLAKSKDIKTERTKLPFEFPIDPEIAKALADDRKRFDELEGSTGLSDRITKGKGDTPEQGVIRTRMAETARKVTCPPCYGFNEYWKDTGPPDVWLEKERWEEIWNLSESEKAQRIARMEVYLHSPEGRERLRLHELGHTSLWQSPAEHEEIERLAALYPEPWAHPGNSALVAWASIGSTPEERKRKAEKDRRRSEKRAALDRERDQNKK